MSAVTIYKYPLDIPFTELHVSADAKVLSVGAQDNHPCVWIQVSPDAPKIKELHFDITTTGRGVPNGRFVDTFQIADTDGSPFVGHVFVQGE